MLLLKGQAPNPDLGPFWGCPEASQSLPGAFWKLSGKYKSPKFQGTKTKLISILKNTPFQGASAKS
jgi:hypothetical protein